jgi:hypothetical protein
VCEAGKQGNVCSEEPEQGLVTRGHQHIYRHVSMQPYSGNILSNSSKSRASMSAITSGLRRHITLLVLKSTTAVLASKRLDGRSAEAGKECESAE